MSVQSILRRYGAPGAAANAASATADAERAERAANALSARLDEVNSDPGHRQHPAA